MSTLHTIARSPRSSLLSSCQGVLNQGDAILFIEDGVYYCLDNDALAALPRSCRVFALREDIQARGLAARLPAGVERVSTKKFVGLCCDFDKVVNWF